MWNFIAELLICIAIILLGISEPKVSVRMLAALFGLISLVLVIAVYAHAFH